MFGAFFHERGLQPSCVCVILCLGSSITFVLPSIMMDSEWKLHIDLSSECVKTVNNDQQFSGVGVGVLRLNGKVYT